MSIWKGEKLSVEVYGRSHDQSIGVYVDGLPAGMTFDADGLQRFLQRRAPGNAPTATSRKEPDAPVFVSGVEADCTNGARLHAVIYNTNTKSADYKNLQSCPRPGHADYTAKMKYGMDYDITGGGHFSGRLTAPLCVIGGLCKQWLANMGILVIGHICEIGGIEDHPYSLDPDQLLRCQMQSDLAVMDANQKEKMIERILSAKQSMDSVGGIIECVCLGMPAGLGGPLFDGLEGKLAQLLFGIPAVKGVEFGSGFSGSRLLGSENNDPYCADNGHIRTLTNHCGGILGGISNGMPLTLRIAVKPTPSIGKPQKSVNLTTLQNETITIKGRHDPCIVPRAVPVAEAAVAIGIYDMILANKENCYAP